MTSVSLRLLQVGFARHLESLVGRGAHFRTTTFPALCGLIRHPSRGYILYDTGYSEHFFEETKTFPERLYRILVPSELPKSESLTLQLGQLGIDRSDVKSLILSHYHADHVAGVRDFPDAQLIAARGDTESFVAARNDRLRSTLRGHLPGLLPDGFESRLRFADDCPRVSLPAVLYPFEHGLDLFGDGSLIAVPLPGHSTAQLGLFLPDADGRSVLLIGDAAWSLPFLREARLPSALATLLMASPKRYEETFMALHRIALCEKSVALLPSHCTTAWREFRDAR